MTNVHQISQETDVLVINTGLHYLEAEPYINVTKKMLKTLLPFAQKKILIWRETTAQHVNSDGGEWPVSKFVCMHLSLSSLLVVGLRPCCCYLH